VGGEYPATDDIPTGSFVRLRVSDTGAGMPPEVLEHALEPFFSTKPKGEGTGLGLSTVYGIVTQASGLLRIHSEPGAGTAISVLLPASEAEAARVPAEEPSPQVEAARGEDTILVVEDEPAMREVARRILARNGHTVLVAAGGAEAIAIAESHDGPIDLLVTDVVMPQMLGKEVAERITAIRPSLRVLYMSGYAHPVLASQGRLEPGVILLEKPFTEAVMLAKVRAVLDAPPAGNVGREAAGRGVHVVVIDDQAMVAMTFRRLIEAAGMEVLAVAGSVAAGLAAVADHSPDVVVVDYLLPDGLGTDAVERILALDPGVRVVMASGSDTPESRDAAMRAGCVAYIDKAAAVHTLVAAVRQAASQPPSASRPRAAADIAAGPAR
jgi:DNA-binding NtrC family response regulator